MKITAPAFKFRETGAMLPVHFALGLLFFFSPLSTSSYQILTETTGECQAGFVDVRF